jgi:predicted dehydrogenase
MKTVGLIGCGTVARAQYAPILANLFKNSGLLFYDTVPEAAAEMAGNLEGEICSLEALIHRSDFIIIATPPESHYDLVKQSIKPEKTILCEKPFLLSSGQAEEIIKLSHELDAHVYAAHVRRFFPAVIAARSFCRTHLLGSLKNIELFEGMRFNWPSQSGYPFQSPLGGVLPDTGSHVLDCMLYILGLDTVDAQFVLNSRNRQPDAEPSHVFRASFSIQSSEINANASVYLSRRNFLSNKINFYFEKGTMEVPLDLKNMVKVSTATGSSILHETHPARNVEEAFIMQFMDILNYGGTTLRVDKFLNTTSLLETLLN